MCSLVLKFWRIRIWIRWLVCLLGRAIGRLLTRGFEFKGARRRRAREREGVHLERGDATTGEDLVQILLFIVQLKACMFLIIEV
jgi:hypothetical protein